MTWTAPAVTTIQLASLMDPTSGFSASGVPTGLTGRVQINYGTGLPGDRDGREFPEGTPVGGAGSDAFPREENFVVGSLTYDESLVSGSGIETVSILGINLGELQNDVSAANLEPDFRGIQPWSFGTIDAGDTITFTDGVLTSLDIDLTADIPVADANFPPAVIFDGTLVFSGNSIRWVVSDTESIDSPFFPIVIDQTIDWELNGVVLAVVPEPSAGLLAFGALSGLVLRRRRH
ncbi:MAG: PEP-CTERM sorting domain-containing protein [Verrucomicrobiota bacterium]